METVVWHNGDEKHIVIDADEAKIDDLVFAAVDAFGCKHNAFHTVPHDDSTFSVIIAFLNNVSDACLDWDFLDAFLYDRPARTGCSMVQSVQAR